MNTTAKIVIVAALSAAVTGAVALKQSKHPEASADAASSGNKTSTSAQALPRLLDLGADKCIPCKMMAPILEELKKGYAGRLDVEFIDVWKNPDAGKAHNIELIPTQIFLDASGRELFRHQGFYGREDILAKWKELGLDLSGKPALVREAPVQVDSRPRDAVCFMCDGDVLPETKTLVNGQTEQRVLCSPHCYFIYYSSIVNPDAKVSVTDGVSGKLIPASTAAYLYGMDAKGRPTIKAFTDKDAATKAQSDNPGSVVTWDVLRSKELAVRCAFCDRAVYPEDASAVRVAQTHAYGCCPMCALGVAARLGKDIEVEVRDALNGEVIRVKTFSGSLASMEPESAVAWAGQKKNADGKMVSAGCFKQAWFVNEDNLTKWVKVHPAATGRQISIAQALSDKMKLTPEQIAKACKLGECK